MLMHGGSQGLVAGKAQPRMPHLLTGPSRRVLHPSRCQTKISVELQKFPLEYDEAMRQAQSSVKAALADGLKLIEVEFPTAGLQSVQGDGEGQSEMNWSMDNLKLFLNGFREDASSIRIFFPDQQEMNVARYGQTADPSAGRIEFGPKFGEEAQSKFPLGYLTQVNAAWSMLGVNLQKFSPAQLVKDSDKIFVVAYPHFNPREELAATEDLYLSSAKGQGRPLIVFNGELDRIRGGYYPGLFFPGIARLAKDFIPNFEAAYYIHNFKGTCPGALFRAYPGPWQVLARNPVDPDQTKVVWTGEERPSLKTVAMEILPAAIAAARKVPAEDIVETAIKQL